MTGLEVLQMNIIDIAISLLILVVGFLAGLFIRQLLPSYFTEKGKNIATKEDIEEITDKVERVKSQYAAELEKLRAEITDRRDLLSNTTNALSGGYMASHPHIVDAINHLWLVILDIDNLTSPFFYIHAILLPREIEALTPEYINKNVPPASEGDYVQRLVEIHQKSEMKRPFVGEKLWLLFSAYRTFALRLCWKVRNGRDKGKLYSWDKDKDGKQDEAIINLVRTFFSDDEFQVLISPGISVPHRILDGLKSKMLSEMNELIFGKHLISMNFEEQQRVYNLLSSRQTDTAKI
jgi:hypothetical protein